MAEQNRKLYLDEKFSVVETFRAPVRWVKASSTHESEFEKPYLQDEYRKMHVDLQDPWWPTLDPPGPPPTFPPFRPPPWPPFEPPTVPPWRWDWLYYPWHETFRCDAECYDSPGEVRVHCSHTVVEVNVLSGPATPSGVGGTSFTLLVGEDVDEMIVFSVRMIAEGRQWQGKVNLVQSLPIPKPIPISEMHETSSTTVYGWHHGVSSNPCGADCDCTANPGEISYTTQQMSVDETQNLSVAEYGANEAACYTWEISAGGGSLSAATGYTTTYTAPSANVGCEDNPTIVLRCSGTVVDTLDIAVTATSVCGGDALAGVGGTGAAVYCGDSSYAGGYRCILAQKCDGSAADNVCSRWASSFYCTADSPWYFNLPRYYPTPGLDAASGSCSATVYSVGWNDARYPADLANGCCPEQLL
jgi:hypothetical protein